jgi:protein SCO1/2
MMPALALLLGCLCLTSLQATESPRVWISIKPVHSVFAALMQGADEPGLLFSGTRSPYEAISLDGVKAGDVLVWVGPELETGLATAIKGLPDGVRVVELLADPDLKVLPSRGNDEERDPWFWLDNRNIHILIDSFTKMLQELDPLRTHVYAKNRNDYLYRLKQLDRSLEFGYKALKISPVLEYQDVLQYFEQAYALKALDRLVVPPKWHANAADLMRLRGLLEEGEARCLLLGENLPAPDLPLLVKDLSLRTASLDILAQQIEPGPDLYFQLMNEVSDRIKACVQADETAEQVKVPDFADIGNYMLVDHLGALFTNENLKGKYSVLYFGYTYCPDICPTSLAVLSQALDLLGEKAKLIQPYFITIDPERDTVAKVRQYVEYFDPRLIGITGKPEMIERMASFYKARYERVDEPGQKPEDYQMDHSASLYLLDPEGRSIAKFLHGINARDLRDQLLKRLP